MLIEILEKEHLCGGLFYTLPPGAKFSASGQSPLLLPDPRKCRSYREWKDSCQSRLEFANIAFETTGLSLQGYGPCPLKSKAKQRKTKTKLKQLLRNLLWDPGFPLGSLLTETQRGFCSKTAGIFGSRLGEKQLLPALTLRRPGARELCHPTAGPGVHSC